MPGAPLILYVPGLKPKPEPLVHRKQLFRCLVEGVRRLDAGIAADLERSSGAFDIAAWTYDFYGVHRDLSLDQEDIDALLQRFAASDEDIAIATSWKRRFLRWMYRTADFLPFTMPKLASEELEVHLTDLKRYVRNENGVADGARSVLRLALQSAAADSRPVLLMAHSMGSVIAYDVLWQLSRDEDEVHVDLLLTMGSPLGQKLIQRRLLGAGKQGKERYPANVRSWINLAAVGELTALDTQLKNDFGEMVQLGLVENIEDRSMFNYYRMRDTLNVHAEYGYLVNEVTAAAVKDWWSETNRLD